MPPPSEDREHTRAVKPELGRNRSKTCKLKESNAWNDLRATHLPTTDLFFRAKSPSPLTTEAASCPILRMPWVWEGHPELQLVAEAASQPAACWPWVKAEVGR